MTETERNPQSAICHPQYIWALCLLALTAGSAVAQSHEVIVETRSQRYFSSFLLFMLIIYCALWLGTFDWVGRDTEKLKGRTSQKAFWASLLMGAGVAGTLLMLLVNVAFIFVATASVAAIFSIYVYQRNMRLPEEQRVLTKRHIIYVLRNLASRLKIGKGGAMAASEAKGDSTEIVLLRKDGESLERLSKGLNAVQTSDAVIAVKELIESAVLSRATDIHLEPKQSELNARFRIDGTLHNVPSYPPELAAPMLSGVKVLAEMDIAEKRRPQDGTFMGKLAGRTLDFRVATTPSVHGETMAIRILDRSAGLIGLDKLGLLPKTLARVVHIINAPHGMLIVCGPTGSGKSTTLYAMLGNLDAYQKNIVTVENPIEYRLDNITQTQVNPKAGVTFPSAMRSFLRQDPDIILVGEIRDAETARVASQAAMTGHFVLTTLHANDATTSLFRLLDLGVEPYLIASSLNAVLGQRLARVLCTQCKIPYPPQPAFLRKIGVKPSAEAVFYKAQGCEECQGTGYRGRKGIFDLFEINDSIRELIRTNPSFQLIKQEARNLGWRTLQETGLTMVINGETSIKELVRVTK